MFYSEAGIHEQTQARPLVMFCMRPPDNNTCTIQPLNMINVHADKVHNEDLCDQ